MGTPQQALNPQGHSALGPELQTLHRTASHQVQPLPPLPCSHVLPLRLFSCHMDMIGHYRIVSDVIVAHLSLGTEVSMNPVTKDMYYVFWEFLFLKFFFITWYICAKKERATEPRLLLIMCTKNKVSINHITDRKRRNRMF